MIRSVLTAALLFLSVAMGTAGANEPADSAIASVINDLSRFEQQLGSSPSKNTANRTLKLLKITRQRLDSSPNQSDPSWIEADQRLSQLMAQLDSIVQGGGSAPATNTPAPVSRPKATPSSAPASRQMISQDLVRLKKLKRDIESATQTMDQGGVKPWQDPAYAQKFQDAAARYQEQLNAYAEFADNPNVQAAADALTRMKQLISVGLTHGSQSSDALGDVQARLAALYQRRKDSRPPPVPEPLTEDALEEWMEQLARARKLAAADYKELAQIKENAYLPNNVGTVESGAPFDMQNVDSMMNAHQDNVRAIDGSVNKLASNLEAQLRHSVMMLDDFDQLDPENRDHRNNRFLGEGQYEQNLDMLDKEIVRIRSAVAFDEALERDTLDAREDLLDRAEEVREEYEEKREEALELSVMPEPASEDDDLIEIAEETLENPDYGVGDVLQLVINADIRHLTRESSEVEFDDVDVSLSGEITLKGTETTTFFEWDEFQVATAEPVGDRYYIFYNTLRKFTSGGTTTPIGRWLLAKRFQGAEILEDNIDTGWW